MKGHNVPLRRCVGCMNSFPKSELLRIVLRTEEGSDRRPGRIVVDTEGRLPGRGAYLCRNRDCYLMAKKKRAINRTFKMEINADDIEGLGEWYEQQ